MPTLLDAQPTASHGARVRPPVVVHFLASRSVAGKERQLLQLVARDGHAARSHALLFAEGGACRAMAGALASADIPCETLRHDTPRLAGAAREVARRLRDLQADVLCTHDYKSNLVGLWAARRAGLPIVAVFHGHTRQDWKIRLYEALDRRTLRRVDRCVCVAQASADRLAAVGVPALRLEVIHNAVELPLAVEPREASRQRLERFWSQPPRYLVGAAGRLSHEKGFDLLASAARQVADRLDAGFVVFGEGQERLRLQRQIAQLRLQDRFILAGQRDDLPQLLPGLDALAVPSRTEGLPTIVLEALAYGAPVVATAVGGVPETLAGDCGCLVPPEQPDALAERLVELLTGPDLGDGLRRRGFAAASARFSAERQAREYHELFARVAQRKPA